MGFNKNRLGLFILTILLLTTNDSISLAMTSKNTRPNIGIRTYHGGRLKMVEGVKFLKLSGSYGQMGEQYGYLMKDDIKAMIAYRNVVDYMKTRSSKTMLFLEGCTPKRYLDFMHGMVKGSGIPYREIFWTSFTPEKMGCTSILVKTKNGLLHGHNQDRLTPGRFKIMVEFNPDKYRRYIVSTYVGTCEVLEGMNDSGISLTQNAGAIREFRMDKPALSYMPPNFKFREILESATSLRDVDRILKGYRHEEAGILIIGSGSESDGVIYDLPYRKKNRLNGNGYLYATNRYLNKDVNDHPETCPRYQIVASHFLKKPVGSIDDMVEILSDPGTTYGVNNTLTIHSVVFDPKGYTIYFTFAPQYAAWGRWLKYDWRTDRVTVNREPLGRKPPEICSPVALSKTLSMKVASIRTFLSSSDDQGRLWAKLSGYLNKNGIAQAGLGFTIYHSNKGKQVDIEVVQPVVTTAVDDRQIKFSSMKSMEMACVTLQGSYEGGDVAYASIYKWVNENGYIITGPFRMVWIKGAWNEQDPKKWQTEIQVPVRKREASRLKN